MSLIIRNMSFIVTLLLLLSACGEAGNTEDTAETSSLDRTPRDTALDTVNSIRSDPTKSTIAGSARFTIDYTEVELSHIPKGRAVYMSMAIQVTFHASEGSQESLMLNIMGADLKALDYPVTLPQERDPKEPLTVANRPATVGWAYMNAEGDEWTTGSAKIQLESLSRDGVLKGRFGETSMRGAGRENIVLNDGEFTVQLTSPW